MNGQAGSRRDDKKSLFPRDGSALQRIDPGVRIITIKEALPRGILRLRRAAPPQYAPGRHRQTGAGKRAPNGEKKSWHYFFCRCIICKLFFDPSTTKGGQICQ